VEDFDEVSVFTDLVVHENGAVRQFSNTNLFTNCAAHARESTQQFHMVEQRTTESLCSLGIILGDMTDDFSEVV